MARSRYITQDYVIKDNRQRALRMLTYRYDVTARTTQSGDDVSMRKPE